MPYKKSGRVNRRIKKRADSFQRTNARRQKNTRDTDGVYQGSGNIIPGLLKKINNKPKVETDTDV